MSPYIFISGMMMILLFFLTLLMNNLYLSVALIVLAVLLIWFITRKWKLCLTGSGIFIVIALLVYMFDHYILKALGNEMVLFVALIMAGVTFSFYIYNKKAIWNLCNIPLPCGEHSIYQFSRLYF